MTGALVSGRTLDRYIVERHLGQGGMATVVQVRHTVLGTVHAMKVLRVSTPHLIDRLLREGRVQAAIQHANLVSVTDVVTVEGGVALILEFVEGPTLSDLIRMFRLSEAEMDALADQVMAGVEAAHAGGIIHRDLKPANVLVAQSPGGLVAKVTDFGLARALEAQPEDGKPLTLSGVPMGTLGYVAPEQIRNARDVDQRADVFSLGALLYELVTGRPPYEAWNLISVYDQVMKEEFLPVDALRPELPPRYQRAIRAALTANPDDRPQDVAALRALWFEGAPKHERVWDPEHLDAVARWTRLHAARGAVALGATEADPGLPIDVGSLPSMPSEGTDLPPLPVPPPSLPGRRQRLAGAAVGAVLMLTVLAIWLKWGGEEPVAVGASSVEPAADLRAAEGAQPGGLAGAEAELAPPAATREPEPAKSADAQAAAESATLVVTGVEGAVLVGDDGARRAANGRVPPGTWRLLIPDKDGGYVQMLRRRFRAGERVRVVCEPSMAVCRER